MNIVRFIILCLIKSSRFWCYPITTKWVSPPPDKDWRDVRLILLLNHTSMFEYIFASAMPTKFLWQVSQRLIFPVASSSLEKPQGKLLKIFAPRVAGLSRKRDETWLGFMDQLASDSILIFMPEGRMKRLNGLDKHGQPMTVKSGICDLLPQFSGERMIIGYSGGLHHIMPPGQAFPRPFKRVSLNLESVDVDDYLAEFAHIEDDKQRREAICRDLERRRDQNCPN